VTGSLCYAYNVCEQCTNTDYTECKLNWLVSISTRTVACAWCAKGFGVGACFNSTEHCPALLGLRINSSQVRGVCVCRVRAHTSLVLTDEFVSDDGADAAADAIADAAADAGAVAAANTYAITKFV
jgi:hypothetical protein